MNPEQEKYFNENFNSYNKSSNFDSFLNMFWLQPMMDNWANIGLAKTTSLYLEKALMTKSSSINYMHHHAFGSRFGIGILNKIPIIGKLFPNETTKLSDNWLFKKLFPNYDVFYNTKFDQQVSEGTVKSSKYYTSNPADLVKNGKINMGVDIKSKTDLLKENVDKADLQIDGEITGHNISWSKKSNNNAVRRLKQLGITADDFKDGKIVLDVDGKETLVNFNKENLDKLITSKVTNEKALRKLSNASDIVKNVKAADNVKELIDGNIKNYIKESVEELSKTNDSVLNFFNKHSKNGVLTITDDILEKATNVVANAKGISKSEVIDDLVNIAMKNATTITNSEKNSLLKTFVQKTGLESLFSSPFGKAITQVGTGKFAFGANIVGSIIGGVASHMQDNAIQNFAKTIVNYQINSNKEDFKINDASLHSIQTHMQRSQDDLEEYKKVLYYRNFSNEMRKDMSNLDNSYLSADDIQTN